MKELKLKFLAGDKAFTINECKIIQAEVREIEIKPDEIKFLLRNEDGFYFRKEHELFETKEALINNLTN